MNIWTGQIQKERKPLLIGNDKIDEFVNINENEKKNITIATSNQQGSIAIGFNDGTIKIIDAKTKQCLYVLADHHPIDASPVDAIHYDGNLLVAAFNPPNRKSTVHVWLLEKKHINEQIQKIKNDEAKQNTNDEAKQNPLLHNAKTYFNQSLQALWNNNYFWVATSIGIGMGLFYTTLKYKFIIIRWH